MTEREKLVELMARAIGEHMCASDREYQYDYQAARDALTALEAAGVRLVPVEATDEMIVDGTETWLCEAAMEDRAGVCWSAMLTASPYAPEGTSND